MVSIFLIGFIPMSWLIAMLIWSIYVPRQRIWPPKHSTITRRIGLWLMTTSVFASGVILGVVDYNALGWPLLPRLLFGIPLLLAGNVVIFWGIATIGSKATMGARDQLRVDGPYRWSRNPQYVADMAIATGWFLVTSSTWVGVLSLSVVIGLLIAPFAEEPWLAETYGDDYERYRQSVRRFL